MIVTRYLTLGSICIWKNYTRQRREKYITIDDFAKVEIRLGTVISVDVVEDADKLYVPKVDLGEENLVKFFLEYESL